MSETRGMPPQFFDKNFLAYIKTLQLRAEIELGKDVENWHLIEKMIEIETADKQTEPTK